MNKTSLAVLLAAIGCSACSSIYVGNISFTETEVCSEEYASRIRTTGCLPPAPVANTQGYFLKRFRLSIPEQDGKNLAELASKDEKSSKTNVVPSIIGRMFKAEMGAGNRVIVPETGGRISFLPDEMNDVPTEIVRMDLTGVVRKKIGLDTNLDAGALIDAAAKSTGLSVPPAVKNQLTLYWAAHKDSIDASSGSYYYASIEPKVLAQLARDLETKGYMIAQSPAQETQETEHWLSNSYAKVENLYAAVPSISYNKDSGNFDFGSDEKDGAKTNDSVLGIVIGAAIIRTKAGRSELCSDMELGNLSGIDPASNCGTLKTILEKFSQGKPWGELPNAAPDAAAAKATEKADQGAFLRAFSFSYANAKYKTLSIGDHSSLLAIQWLPIRRFPQLTVETNPKSN